MKLEHLGIAVKSLENSVPVFEKIFGVKAGGQEYVAEQKVNVRKIKLENFDVELLEPTSPESPIGKFIEKRGEGMHHLCIEVDDIEAKMQELKDAGIRLINDVPQVLPGRKMAFIHPKSASGVLVELYEITAEE